MAKVEFKKSEDLMGISTSLFQKQYSRIKDLLRGVDIQHVGSSAVPGALTVGDLDIQIRCTAQQFTKAKDLLTNLYMPRHVDLWNNKFALFADKTNPVMPISVVLTVKDSKYDDFYKFRDLLINDSRILEKYNAFKKSYEGKDEKEYWKAKRVFLGPNGEWSFLK